MNINLRIDKESIMKNNDYIYKITESIVSIILVALMLAIFVALVIIEWNMMLFVFPFIGFFSLTLIYLIYRFLVVKIYVYENGFFHSSSLIDKHFYEYAEIKKAWDSTKGNKDCFNYTTQDGVEHTMSYRPNQYNFDAIKYMLIRINGEEYYDNYIEDENEYDEEIE